MMGAADRLADTFPHGTVDGYRAGCRDANCPAPLACRDVNRRYAGDYAFRRLVDAGVSLEDILAREAEERVGIEQRDKAAARAARRGTTPPAPTAATVAPHPKAPQPKPRALQPKREPAAAQPASIVPVDPMARWRQERDAWRAQRKDLYAKLAAAERELAAATARRDAAQTAFDVFAASGEPEKPKRKSQRSEQREKTRADVRRLHAAGLSDAEMATNLNFTASYINLVRRELKLPANVKRRSTAIPREPRAPRQVLGHGTNASYARGCRCDACKKAAAAYKQEWLAKRADAAEAITAEQHGTAYGYQLGCRSRKLCPADPSCADASLAEERRRRREAGVPAAAPRVDAEPARAHVRALMAGGMTLDAIALAAAVPRSRLGDLIYGRSDRGNELPAQLEAHRAADILAVKGAA